MPQEHRALFSARARVLETHRGFDRGAAALAHLVADTLGAPLVVTFTTRLLVDCNRTFGNPAVLSPWSRALPAAERDRLLEEHYLPYRQAVEAEIAAGISRRDAALHLSIHSFTPVLRVRVRQTDLGLLFDQGRPWERSVAARLQAALRARAPGLRVRRNYPYRGVTDGFMPFLRRRYPDRRYAGVELEMNQAFPRAGGARWSGLQQVVLDAFLSLAEELS